MSKVFICRPHLVAAFVFFLFSTAITSAEQGTTVTGQLRHSVTLKPVTTATILIEGTGLEARSDQEGRFSIASALRGERDWRTRERDQRGDSHQSHSGCHGGAVIDLGTAASEFGGATDVSWGNGQWALRGGASGRHSGDVKTPAGTVENTQPAVGDSAGHAG